ncbi:MAG: ATP synthase subunit I [Syntrophobacteraceae bacterium]|nr:ATP synthase subunit I [Syntrophobacteraceae bacterium]
MTPIDESEKLLQRIELVSAILLIVLTLGAAFFFSWNSASGVFIGGGIVVISFQVLKWQLRRTLQKPGKLPTRAAVFLSYYVRFLATLFVIFLVMYLGLAKPFPILIGLSVMVLSIVLVGAFEFIMMKKEES